GIIFSDMRVGAFNGNDFLTFLDNLLKVMNPWPGDHSILILDNCAIHHVEGVAERCAARGVRVL
ncbi:hypothetical protein AURDEDRAFT_27063, partial [Auricularia subglabra TFB-10046 SS5]